MPAPPGDPNHVRSPTIRHHAEGCAMPSNRVLDEVTAVRSRVPGFQFVRGLE